MTNNDRLELYRKVVHLKMQYWDALRRLEVELVGRDPSDAQANALSNNIDCAAASLGEPSTVWRIKLAELDSLVAAVTSA